MNFATAELASTPEWSADEAVDALLAAMAQPQWAKWRQHDRPIEVGRTAVSVDHRAELWVARTTMERANP